MEFTETTRKVTALLSKSEKKQYGIFMTPPTIIDRVLTRIQPLITTPNPRILEPSCGTCEFILAAVKKFPQATFDGIEWNTIVYDHIKNLAIPNTHLYHADFMRFTPLNNSETYDVVIGNPPYFVCHKEDIPECYQSFMVGRPNIFGAFICHSLTQLKMGGILAFVIPKSFMNTSYYGAIRKHIIQTCSVISIIDCQDCSDFLDTQQTTFIMILQKGVSKNCHKEEYVVPLGDQVIFTPSAKPLIELLAGSTTLKALGYSVRTGTVVWNEHKGKLTSDSTKPMLIYNTNVVSNKLEIKTFSNEEKKQFIDLSGSTTACLVVNRGNGNSVYKLSYALVPAGKTYLVENHLNMITHPNGDYSAIIKSFQDPRTQLFIDCVLGNGGLSKTELETIFPIFT